MPGPYAPLSMPPNVHYENWKTLDMQGFSAALRAYHRCMAIGDRSFLAGFLEGEASLSIREQNGGQSYSCEMALNQRDDEQDTMERLVATTGLGRLYRVPARSTSKPQIAWLVNTQEHCGELLALIERGFHGRRTAELRLWSQAVRRGPRAAASRAGRRSGT